MAEATYPTYVSGAEVVYAKDPSLYAGPMTVTHRLPNGLLMTQILASEEVAGPFADAELRPAADYYNTPDSPPAGTNLTHWPQA